MPDPPFFTRYGFARRADPEAPLVLEPYDEICRGGVLRATVVASAIDLVGGFATRALAGVDATFTADLSLRIPRPGRPARLTARSETLRAGRRLVTTGVRLETDDGATYAEGVTTFTRIARDPSEVADPAALATPDTIPSHPLTRPLTETVGIECDAAGSGCVRVPLRATLRNPEGVMQGALVALLVEEAALDLAGADGRGATITSLDLRYLAAATDGPIEGTASWIGPPDASMMRVTLRDLGRDARRTATAFVRVAPL